MGVYRAWISHLVIYFRLDMRVLVLISILSVLSLIECATRVQVSKHLFPYVYPGGYIEDTGHHFVTYGRDNTAYVIRQDGMTMFCTLDKSMRMSGIKIYYIGEAKCNTSKMTYKGTGKSASSTGAMAIALCNVQRQMARDGPGTVDVWYEGKHKGC